MKLYKTNHQSNCEKDLTVLNSLDRSLKIIWMDSDETAKYLCISVETLRNLTSNGQIPYYKFGRRNRYRKDEINALLLRNKRGKYGD